MSSYIDSLKATLYKTNETTLTGYVFAQIRFTSGIRRRKPWFDIIRWRHTESCERVQSVSKDIRFYANFSKFELESVEYIEYVNLFINTIRNTNHDDDYYLYTYFLNGLPLHMVWAEQDDRCPTVNSAIKILYRKGELRMIPTKCIKPSDKTINNNVNCRFVRRLIGDYFHTDTNTVLSVHLTSAHTEAFADCNLIDDDRTTYRLIKGAHTPGERLDYNKQKEFVKSYLHFTRTHPWSHDIIIEQNSNGFVLKDWREYYL
jgi:hypothetical protein